MQLSVDTVAVWMKKNGVQTEHSHCHNAVWGQMQRSVHFLDQVYFFQMLDTFFDKVKEIT